MHICKVQNLSPMLCLWRPASDKVHSPVLQEIFSVQVTGPKIYTCVLSWSCWDAEDIYAKFELFHLTKPGKYGSHLPPNQKTGEKTTTTNYWRTPTLSRTKKALCWAKHKKHNATKFYDITMEHIKSNAQMNANSCLTILKCLQQYITILNRP